MYCSTFLCMKIYTGYMGISGQREEGRTCIFSEFGYYDKYFTMHTQKFYHPPPNIFTDISPSTPKYYDK